MQRHLCKIEVPKSDQDERACTGILPRLVRGEYFFLTYSMAHLHPTYKYIIRQ
jgi:hypothetical protein